MQLLRRAHTGTPLCLSCKLHVDVLLLLLRLRGRMLGWLRLLVLLLLLALTQDDCPEALTGLKGLLLLLLLRRLLRRLLQQLALRWELQLYCGPDRQGTTSCLALLSDRGGHEHTA
jgi:hypothetical protein